MSNGRALNGRDIRFEMSVDVGMGIGRGHVTLGHGGNVNATTAATDANHDNPQGGQTSPPWSVQCWDTLDQVDHLILLPERALTMDSGWLQADLAEILAHSVIGHGRGVTPFLSHTEQTSFRDGSDGWSPSRRRSLDWSLVNPTGQQSPSFVAIASSSDRKFSKSPVVVVVVVVFFLLLLELLVLVHGFQRESTQKKKNASLTYFPREL